jgi:hypothetical protein
MKCENIDIAARRAHQRNIAAAIALCIGFAAVGCDRHRATVDGRITLDGQPLHGGTVTFHPRDGGQPGYAVIASDGSYAIRTGESEGLAPGRYAVTVIALQPSATASSQFGMPSPGEHITPPRYASASTTDLTADVHEGANQLDFSLSTP